MDTPICDFVRDYADSGALRLHMPGHKGAGPLERLDITEIEGADVLYQSEGIIRRSEENAAALFGTARTLYSTEGSSLAIRAMLYLALLHARERGKRPCIAAGRNAHKVFLTGAALLDLEIHWLCPAGRLLSCPLTAAGLEEALGAMETPPAAVYVTSPDYLGNMLDIAALARVCKQFEALLLVDNAHGAYLNFLPGAPHPMRLGADLCCDSAHKTLPVLTGGAYLHISKTAPAGLAERAEQAMALFASTSPSYLLLQSLDAANARLAGDYPAQLEAMAREAAALKGRLEALGYVFAGDEPLKLSLRAKAYGYTGQELAALLGAAGIVCEFADPDFLVLMLSPATGTAGLERLEAALTAIPRRPAIETRPPRLPRPAPVLSPREALLAPAELLPVEEALGRILAAPGVSCPPAVPILTCGEAITEEAIECFRYYGIEACRVVKCRAGWRHR